MPPEGKGPAGQANNPFLFVMPKGLVTQRNDFAIPLTYREQQKLTRDKVVQHMEKNIWVVTYAYGDNYYNVQKGSTLVLDFDFTTGTLSPTGNYDNDNPTRHHRVFNTTGVLLERGDQCLLGYRGQDIRQKPFIKAIFRRPFGQQVTIDEPATLILIGRWVQSNASTNQLVLGLTMTPPFYNIVGGSTVDWRLPTKDVVDEYEESNVAHGLAWAYHSGADAPEISHLVTGWPVLRSADSVDDYAIGAWDATTHSLIWKASFTAGVDQFPADNLLSTAKFFYCQTNRWAHMIPTPENALPICYSAKSENVKSTTTLQKKAYGANVGGVTLALPFSDETLTSSGAVEVQGLDVVIIAEPVTWTTSGTSSGELFEQNTSTLEWESAGTYHHGELLSLGRAIASKAAHAESGGSYFGPNEPLCWYPHDNAGGDMFLVFSSGREVLDATNDNDKMVGWDYRVGTAFLLNPILPPFPTSRNSSHYRYGKKIKWSLDKVSKSTSANLSSKTISATTPRSIDGDTFDDNAVAAWSGGGYSGGVWTNQTALVASASHTFTIDITPWNGSTYTVGFPDYSYFENAVPVIMPFQLAVTGRIDGLSDLTGLGTALATNSSGGIVVTDREVGDNYIFFCVAEPYQVTYGGFFTEASLSNTAYENRVYEGTVEVFFDSGVGYNIDGIGISQGMKPRYQVYWLKRQGFLWRTILYCLDANSGTILSATNISQVFDSVPHTEPSVASTTVDDIEILDNVWRIIPFIDQGVVAVLRDLHADALDGNPAPYLEVYSFPDMIKLSTTALGSTELFTTGGTTTTTIHRKDYFHVSDSVDTDGITYLLDSPEPVTAVTAVYLNDDEGSAVGYTFNASPDTIILDSAMVDPDYLVVEYDYEVTGDLIPEGSQIGDRVWNPYRYGPPRMKGCISNIEGTDTATLVIMIHEEKKVNTAVSFKYDKVTYHRIELVDPEIPTVTTDVLTSPDPTALDTTMPLGGTMPLSAEFDSLLITNSKGAWIRKSKFYELQE